MTKSKIIEEFKNKLLGYADFKILRLLYELGEYRLYNEYLESLNIEKDYCLRTALTIIKHKLKKLSYKGDYGQVFYKKDVKDNTIEFLINLSDSDEMGEDVVEDVYDENTKEWHEKVICTMFSEEDLEEALNSTIYKTKYTVEAEWAEQVMKGYIKLCDLC